METQLPQPQPAVEPIGKKNLFPVIFWGTVIGIIVISVILLTLNYFNKLQLSNLNPSLSSLPHKQPADLQINPALASLAKNCSVINDNLGLVKYIIPSEGGIVGAVYGIIKNIVYDNTSNSAVITLISPNGKYQHDFTIKADNNLLIYNEILKKTSSLSNLSVNQNLLMPYECKPKNNNQFIIIQILVVNN